MLDSYQEGQVLYGRDEEISSITESIEYNVQTFLYGKSGIGKTSLIQAGIFPRLREAHYFPVVIRLAFYGNEPLREVVKRLVEEEAERKNTLINKQILSHSPIDDVDLTDAHLIDYFSKTKFEDENGIAFIPVLVFDQFEETINNEDNWQRTVDFLNDELYDLMDNSTAVQGNSLPYTNYRVVFSMREDYLYCLEDIVDRYGLWELRNNRFRIKALTDDKAAEIIRKTFGANCLEEEKEELIVNTIIKIVKLNSGTRFTEINTALLSLVCSLLYDNSIEGCIRYSELRNINIYLRSYYDDICDHIGSRAARYLEKHLLTEDGRRSSIDESEALNSGKIDKDSLEYLVEKRLLRRIKTDSTSVRYEYIHDLFARMVFIRTQEDIKKRTSPELRSLSRKMDVQTFVGKSFIIIILSLIMYVSAIAYHSYQKHNNWAFWDIKCINSISYYFLFLTSTYLFSLVTKRLHDVNKTGWLCFLFPISITLIFTNHFSPSLTTDTIFIIQFIGLLLLSYFMFLCFKSGTKESRRYGYSIKYESIYNHVAINNIDFIKALLVELLWWIVCCCMTDVFLNICYNFDGQWQLFQYKLPLFGLDVAFNLNYEMPAFLSLLPLILCASPALKSRSKKIGGFWLSYVPYFNILLLLVALLPDNILIQVGLIEKDKKDNNKPEDILVEIDDDFKAVKLNYHFNQKEKNIIIVRSLLIPFYGIIFAFNKKNKLGCRKDALLVSSLKCLYVIGVWLLYVSMEVDIAYSDVIIAVFIISLIVSFLCLVCRFILNITKSIIFVIQDNPSCSINQIANELLIRPHDVEKRINYLKKNGELSRVEENGKIIWFYKGKADC